MLRRFFKGRDRLNDPDPAVRRESVATLDAASLRDRSDVLARLLTDDPDRGVRLAVIDRLESIDLLARVLDDAAVGDAAARRIEVLARLHGGPVPQHARLTAGRLATAPDAERHAVVTGMTDPEQLIGLALKDRGALRSAVLAHPLLNTANGLSLLEKRSRGADKSVNRHAREALDELKRLQHEIADARARAEELAQALGRASATTERAAHDRAVHLYRQCLLAIDRHDVAGAALARFGEACESLEALRARLVVPEPPAEPEPDPPPAEPAHADAAAPAARESTDPAPLQPAARSAGEPVAPERAVTAPAAEAALQSPADAAPGADPAAPDDTHATQSHARADRRAAAEADATARRAAHTAIDALFDRVEAALDAGEIATAQRHLMDARHQHDQLGAAAARALTRRLGRLSAALAELRDWQTFATAPKREALCEAVRALVTHPLPPADQAERLKTLRAAWRELGPAGRARDARLAENFNTLAEQAFEPCRAYFAEQAELRRSNLEERKRICAQLETYLAETDWQRADMKAAERILRTAREAWLGCSPVDRQAGRTVEQRFERLQDQLHDHLKAFWEQNAAAKEALVAEAETLLTDTAEIEQRISRAKDLQQRWRSIGAVLPRQRDQALWSGFRAACDALFAARDDARVSAQAETRALAGQCAAVLDDFEHALGELTPEQASEAQARTLQERLRDLERLPPVLRQPLIARRGELLDRHRRLLRARASAGRLARLAEFEQRDVQAPPAVGSPASLDMLRRLTLRAEQAAGIPPPPEDEPLRREVQVERLRAGFSGSDDEDPMTLAERWVALGAKDTDAQTLRTRFFAALRARLA